jgi:hypothetical protein
MTFWKGWYNALMNKKWYIEIFNIFTKKRVKGVVTGDIEKIKEGLAQAGWDTLMSIPSEHMTHGI